jgi:hypothetical protein
MIQNKIRASLSLCISDFKVHLPDGGGTGGSGLG